MLVLQNHIFSTLRFGNTNINLNPNQEMVMNPIILYLLLKDESTQSVKDYLDTDIGWWFPISIVIGVLLGLALVYWPIN